MTEDEWFQGEDARTMISFLGSRASPRKLRLLLCGIARQEWHRITALDLRHGIEIAEQHADGFAAIEQLREASEKSRFAAFVVDEQFSIAFEAAHGKFRKRIKEALRVCAASNAAAAAVAEDLQRFFTALATDIEDGVAADALMAWQKAIDESLNSQTEMVREIFGNPFHLVEVDHSWLTWHNGTCRALAETIYAERRWDAMPILADALEEAGCTDAAILQHCREPREHVRGCWVVDLLLGKEHTDQ